MDKVSTVIQMYYGCQSKTVRLNICAAVRKWN